MVLPVHPKFARTLVIKMMAERPRKGAIIGRSAASIPLIQLATGTPKRNKRLMKVKTQRNVIGESCLDYARATPRQYNTATTGRRARSDNRGAWNRRPLVSGLNLCPCTDLYSTVGRACRDGRADRAVGIAFDERSTSRKRRLLLRLILRQLRLARIPKVRRAI